MGFDTFGDDGQDCHGHGTHVAGTVGGATYGAAKNVNLVSVRVLNCGGWGTVSGVIDGIEWVANHRVLPAVANLSLGGGPSDALDAALEKMISSGVTTVVAAGNQNSDACGTSTARVSSAITVGASDSADVKPLWSNYGSCVDWFAPGNDILSAWGSSDTATAMLSGTSMAAPHTAGVAALYLETHPTENPTQVRDALFSFTSKGRVIYSQSVNNHLLYSMEEIDDGSASGSPGTSLTSPLSGTFVTPGTRVIIKAQVSRNGAKVSRKQKIEGISRVEFSVNGFVICSDIVAPYSCTWRVPMDSSVSYDLQSVVYDIAGNIGSSSVISVKSR